MVMDELWEKYVVENSVYSSTIHGAEISKVGSLFTAVRFTTIHFYDPCRVGPSTTNLWCITVAPQASFLYLVRF